MKKTKFVSPFINYNRNGNSARAFKERLRPGVYIVKKGSDFLYIGYSGKDVIKTMYRHFYEWNDRQYRVTFNPADQQIKVRVIYLNKPEQAAKLEKALLTKYKTKYNYSIPAESPAGSKEIISKYLNLTEEAPF